MIYSRRIKNAIDIMFEAHKDDVDKGGYPYVFHPFYVATRMDDEQSTIVALLHDVVEDHGDKYTYKYLEEQGFTKEEIEAIKLVTHEHAKSDEEYFAYIKNIAKNPLATKVKIEDLKHNLDDTRLFDYKYKSKDRYIKSLEYLEKCLKEGNANGKIL